MFNLSKHADFAEMVGDASGSLQEGFEEPEAVTRSEGDIIGDLGPQSDERQRVLDLQSEQELMRVLQGLATNYPNEIEAINSVLTSRGEFAQLKNELAGLPALTEDYGMEALAPQVRSFDEFKIDENSVLNAVRRLNAIRLQEERNRLPLAAFNLSQHKQAQMPMAQMPPQMAQPMPQEETGRFPVENEGDFIAKFADDLLSFNNKPGTPEYEKARQAAEEIRSSVSPALEEEANSVLEAVMQLDPRDRDVAAQHLMKLYEVLLPPAMTGDQAQMMEPVMGQNQDGVEGIVRYNLTDQVLNNKQASSEEGMVKTAADQFGQQYLLYGPTEKRICPKLRGKNLSVGDVVSEYTCRHHCIDGVVIDDNKTICGEALWRANAMDKYSREYVDEDGNIEGGYINKRFEINRNVPEENKMRLKPGETRKPRPASQGNMESRLQDMRAKEGQSRDYRPQTNTGDPFVWCHDVDQNNVEVSQAERDRREETSGHELVQYTNRDQGENNPKKAFNLKGHKTAQAQNADSAQIMEAPDIAMPIHEKTKKKNPRDRHHTAVNPTALNILPPEVSQGQRTDQGKPMEKKRSFNLQEAKEAQLRDVDRRMRARRGLYGQDPFDPLSQQAPRWCPNCQRSTAGAKQCHQCGGETWPDKLGPEYNEQPPAPSFYGNRASKNEVIKEAKSPPGFKHTVEHMKAKHGDEIDNAFALAWWMKNKGHKSHKGPGDVHKCDSTGKGKHDGSGEGKHDGSGKGKHDGSGKGKSEDDSKKKT